MVPPSTTVTVPAMPGWWVHRYANVPASAKVCDHCSPLAMSPESKGRAAERSVRAGP